MDALYLLANPHVFQLNINCNNLKNRYSKLFGSAQDYEALFLKDPQDVVSHIRNVRDFRDAHFVIDWNYDISEKSDD